MAVVFEDRNVYDGALDDVATLTLTVECDPVEVAGLSKFLVGVSAKPGVYSVSMDHTVAITANRAGAARLSGESRIVAKEI